MLLPRGRWRALLVLPAAIATALTSYAVVAQTTDQGPPPPGVSADAQRLLHMTKPTHQQPTPWGEFLIDPVFAPREDQIDDAPSPLPVLGVDARSSGELAGAQAPSQAAAKVRRFVSLGQSGQLLAARMGLVAVAASASEDASGAFVSTVFYAGEAPAAMLSLTAYTPTRPVVISEFPDTAIYDFRTSSAVNANPTITKFPDKGTSDPNGDRQVMWSQDHVVYFLRSFGPFTDGELLAVANEISKSQEGRR